MVKVIASDQLPLNKSFDTAETSESLYSEDLFSTRSVFLALCLDDEESGNPKQKRRSNNKIDLRGNDQGPAATLRPSSSEQSEPSPSKIQSYQSSEATVENTNPNVENVSAQGENNAETEKWAYLVRDLKLATPWEEERPFDEDSIHPGADDSHSQASQKETGAELQYNQGFKSIRKLLSLSTKKEASDSQQGALRTVETNASNRKLGTDAQMEEGDGLRPISHFPEPERGPVATSERKRRRILLIPLILCLVIAALIAGLAAGLNRNRTSSAQDAASLSPPQGGVTFNGTTNATIPENCTGNLSKSSAAPTANPSTGPSGGLNSVAPIDATTNPVTLAPVTTPTVAPTGPPFISSATQKPTFPTTPAPVIPQTPAPTGPPSATPATKEPTLRPSKMATQAPSKIVTPAPSACTNVLSVDKSCYNVLIQETIVVQFSECNPHPDDWVAMYVDVGKVPTVGKDYVAWLWTCGTQQCQGQRGGVLQFRSSDFPLQRYRIFLVRNNPNGPPYRVLAASNSFSIQQGCS